MSNFDDTSDVIKNVTDMLFNEGSVGHVLLRVCRRLFDGILMVIETGLYQCSGRYSFDHLDSRGYPVFQQTREKHKICCIDICVSKNTNETTTVTTPPYTSVWVIVEIDTNIENIAMHGASIYEYNNKNICFIGCQSQIGNLMFPPSKVQHWHAIQERVKLPKVLLTLDEGRTTKLHLAVQKQDINEVKRLLATGLYDCDCGKIPVKFAAQSRS